MAIFWARDRVCSLVIAPSFMRRELGAGELHEGGIHVAGLRYTERNCTKREWRDPATRVRSRYRSYLSRRNPNAVNIEKCSRRSDTFHGESVRIFTRNSYT